MLNEKGRKLLTVFLNLPKWLQVLGYVGLIAAILFANAELLPFEYMRF